MPLMTGSDGSVRFIGDGVGDRFGPVVAPDAPPGTLDALCKTLRTHPGKLLVLTNVERGAEWRKSLEHPRGHSVLVDRKTLLPYLDLTGLDWPGFLASRSANFRSQIGRKSRALAHSYEVRSRLAATPLELSRDLDRLFKLHDQRWARRGSSSSSSTRMREFLALVCRRAFDQGWLRLWTLELDGTPVAAWLGWNVGGSYAYYLAGFDPAFGPTSPGLVLLARTVEAATDEGAYEYDFLLGDEPYKSRFANAAREVETEIIGPALSGLVLVVRLERSLRRAGRILPEPARERVNSVVQNVQHVLPWGRYR